MTDADLRTAIRLQARFHGCWEAEETSPRDMAAQLSHLWAGGKKLGTVSKHGQNGRALCWRGSLAPHILGTYEDFATEAEAKRYVGRVAARYLAPFKELF
jgi:hypothetical protein